MLKLPILFLAFLSSVSAHGGVLWPPIWQAGVATPIEELTTYGAFSDPKVHDHHHPHHHPHHHHNIIVTTTTASIIVTNIITKIIITTIIVITSDMAQALGVINQGTTQAPPRPSSPYDQFT